MKTDLLASRHIGINEQDTALMLRKWSPAWPARPRRTSGYS